MNPPTIMLIAAIAINIFQLAFFTSNYLYHHIIFITKKVSYCKSTSKTWNLLDESNRTSLALTFFSSTTHIAVLRAASAREREWESVLQKNERERESRVWFSMMRKRRGIKRTKTRFEVRKGVAAKIGHRPEPAIRSRRNPSNKSHGQSLQSELNVTVKSINVFILLWYCLNVDFEL